MPQYKCRIVAVSFINNNAQLDKTVSFRILAFSNFLTPIRFVPFSPEKYQRGETCGNGANERKEKACMGKKYIGRRRKKKGESERARELNATTTEENNEQSGQRDGAVLISVLSVP